MKRKLFVMVIAAVSVCVMAACGSQDGSKKKTDTEQVAEGTNEVEADDGDEAGSDVKKAIVKLVKAVNNDINALSGEKPNVDLIDKYCSKNLRQLVAKISDIDRNKPAGEGYATDGKWANVLWAFYEPPFEIEKIDVYVDGDEGTVSYLQRKGGEKVEMDYRVVLEDGEWRFDDCERMGMMARSWVEDMNEYIEENR